MNSYTFNVDAKGKVVTNNVNYDDGWDRAWRINGDVASYSMNGKTYVLTPTGWKEWNSLKETKETNVRKLYEVFLVDQVDGNVKDYLELATSEADAIMLAVLEAGIVKADLSNWVKKARFVCDVPETDG